MPDNATVPLELNEIDKLKFFGDTVSVLHHYRIIFCEVLKHFLSFCCKTSNNSEKSSDFDIRQPQIVYTQVFDFWGTYAILPIRKCLNKCPQHIDIPKVLEIIVEELEIDIEQRTARAKEIFRQT